MSYQQTREIKRAQKESLLFRELSKLLLQISIDDKALAELYINRIKLSPDKSVCTAYFYTTGGKEAFATKLSTLILYKPSLRTALAKTLESRYTPELVFKFDEQYEKQKHIEDLLNSIKVED